MIGGEILYENEDMDNICTSDLYLIWGIACLEPYQSFIRFDIKKINELNANFESFKAKELGFAEQVHLDQNPPDDQSIYCKPLSFDSFYMKCHEKLN